MKRSTIKDVANRLGVNPSTVSRALKDHPDIGLALREEIKRVALEMKYTPNQMAVQLRQRQRQLVGLVIPEITMFFYPSVIRGIEEVLEPRGYQLVMLPSNESPAREAQNLKFCDENQLAGVLISFTRHTLPADGVSLLSDLDMPVVVFDKSLPDLPFDSVMLEDEEAACRAARFLIDSGCKRIGGLFGSPHLLITQQRLRGFRRALSEAGLLFDESLARFAGNAAEADDCAREMMTLEIVPDAVFMMSDEIVMGAYPAILRSGIDIPGECSVICISDGFIPKCYYPEISYLHHDGAGIGREAALRLLDLIESDSSVVIPRQQMVHAELVELESTKRIIQSED
jgi:LacI family transcriptional regulator